MKRGYLHWKKEDLQRAVESSRAISLSRVIHAGPHFIKKKFKTTYYSYIIVLYDIVLLDDYPIMSGGYQLCVFVLSNINIIGPKLHKTSCQ